MTQPTALKIIKTALMVLMSIGLLVTASPSYAQDSGTAVTVDQQTLSELNPLRIGSRNLPYDGADAGLADQLSTPTGIISRLLVFAFPLAGLILFVMIIWGGFDMLSGASAKKNIEEGRKRVEAAIVGFILLFSSYWIIQIIEAIFLVNIITF